MKLKIGNKLALVMISLSIVVIAILASLFYYQFSLALRERVLLQLSSVKQLKSSQIKDDLQLLTDAFNLSEDSTDLSDLGFSKIVTSSQPQVQIDNYKFEIPNTLQSDPTIIDITTQHPAGQITLAFVRRVDEGYLIAVSNPSIQSILLERTGLGESGESYLVGKDHFMRSASRFLDTIPTTIKVSSEGVANALSDNPGTGIFKDYRGIEVLSSYEKLELFGLEWVILSEIDTEEAFIPLQKLRRNFYIILIVILLFVLVASYWLSKQIVKPILLMESRLAQMAKGQIDLEIKGKQRSDEIGQMFSALNRHVSALHQAIDFAKEIGGGNFNKDYHLLSKDDQLGKALLQMQSELTKLKDREARLVRDNQRALLNGEEGERSRMSRELHDGLGPLLTSIRLKVQISELSQETKKDVLQIIDDTIGEVRRISNNLMPSVLEDFGAGEAISNMVKSLSQGEIQIKYRYEPLEEVKLSKASNITLYRIAQEALNNAIKHSKASEIKISLTEFADKVSLFIFDDGQGFDTELRYSGSGLINIKERVRMEDGLFEIHSDESGTKIEIEIPIR